MADPSWLLDFDDVNGIGGDEVQRFNGQEVPQYDNPMHTVSSGDGEHPTGAYQSNQSTIDRGLHESYDQQSATGHITRNEAVMETQRHGATMNASQSASYPSIATPTTALQANVPKNEPKGRRPTPLVTKEAAAANYTFSGKFSTPGAARTHLDGRCTTVTVRQDDHQQVELDFDAGVKRLFEALTHAHDPSPESLTPGLEKYYASNQVDAAKRLHNRMSTLEMCELVEAYAGATVAAILSVHKNGVPRRVFLERSLATRAGLKPEMKIKCSQRLELVVKAVKENKIVAEDVIHGDYDELVRSPSAYLKRKIAYVNSNGKKKVKADGKKGEPAAGDALLQHEPRVNTPTPRALGPAPRLNPPMPTAFKPAAPTPLHEHMELFSSLGAQYSSYDDGPSVPKKRRRDHPNDSTRFDSPFNFATGPSDSSSASPDTNLNGHENAFGNSPYGMELPNFNTSNEGFGRTAPTDFGGTQSLAQSQRPSYDTFPGPYQESFNPYPDFSFSYINPQAGAMQTSSPLAQPAAFEGPPAHRNGDHAPYSFLASSNQSAQIPGGSFSSRPAFTDSMLESMPAYSTGATEMLGEYRMNDEAALNTMQHGDGQRRGTRFKKQS
ncbi:unnamed protein product [Zymoseptoria tritici ST99CH_1E4]|uniref:Uncharacterized protein n=1 Tax=Zymoseptoria tritici ST99CH_1E4 TaxID=1276532 RepID=A0A2H1GZ00_ZYMTR|nr:unnamed protein product [Zymoseptoria tritici ST99CH_1E4]